MVKKTNPYEDYFKNVVKPKVLKGEEETLDNKWKRLVPVAYREIIKEQQDKIDEALNKIQYIIDYGFDYDGFNTTESLKGLIDMLVDYARQSKDILNGGDK